MISANTGAGVRLEGSATGAAARTIRGNSIFLNGAEGILRTLGAEGDVAPPVVLDATANGASGTACAGCIVEVFTDFDEEGFTFHGSTTANGAGAWTFTCQIDCPFPDAALTATATNQDGNTSMFSAPLVLDLTVTFDLFAGATGQLWTGTPIPLADLDTFPGVSLRAFTQVTALFHWNNDEQRFDFWFRGFPIGFQTLAGGLETGKFYFFQSPSDGTVGIPNGNLFTLPQPGGSFTTFAGATGQLWSGTDIPMTELDDAPPAGLPAAISALFSWSNQSQRFDFWFRGFPDAFQTLTEGIVRGRFYFFQSNQAGVQVPMD